MTEFRARIARVRMRDGASVSILPTPRNFGDPENPENWRGKLVQHAKDIADNDDPGSKLDGYIVIGMYSDGCTSIGYRMPSRIPPCLVPAYVAELLRRDVISETAASRVFDNMFQWVD